MKSMSEFISKLEGYSELEVSIIRTTKINKVLKAIIKLSSIPREEEFKFKSRSQTLLDKWNKLLASEQGTPVAATNGTTESKVDDEEKSSAPAVIANDEESKAEVPKTEAKSCVQEEGDKTEKAVDVAPQSESKDVIEPSKTESNEKLEESDEASL